MTVRARLSHAARVDLDGYRPEHVTERIRRAVEREGVADEAGVACLVAADDGARARFLRSLAVSVLLVHGSRGGRGRRDRGGGGAGRVNSRLPTPATSTSATPSVSR